MIVGIDFDNTIVCYDMLFRDEAEKRGWIPAGLPARKEAVKNYLCGQEQEDLWTELQGYIYGPGIQQAGPYPGFVEWLRSCNECGIQTYIISHKTRFPYLGPKYDLHQSARNWLFENGLLGATQLQESDVCFALTKAEKLQLIAKLACNYFIDDLPEFLLEADFPVTTEKILFDPNNLHTDSSVFQRVADWSEVMKIFTPVEAVDV